MLASDLMSTGSVSTSERGSSAPGTVEPPSRAHLDEITKLIEAGQLTPVIDRTYPLAEAAQAVHLVEQGRPAGKVTITITSAQ